MLDPGAKPQEHPFLLRHGIGSRSDNYSDWEAMNFANSRGRRPAQGQPNYGSYTSTNEHESGVCSPPLWKTSPTRSQPHQKSNHYRSLSPASRAQAIARGQNELMEMVRNMPESCYELSLKDLVEQPMVLARQQQSMPEEEDQSRDVGTENLFRGDDDNKKKRNISTTSDRKASAKRNGNLENGGFLLKMVFPVTFGSKTKKKMNKNESISNTSASAKVSPKPLISEGSVKGVDKEWWRKRFSVSGESESGDSSINSGSMKSNGSRSSSSSTSRSSSRRGSGSCWSFIFMKKSKRRSE
ncbi:hypothetical protein FNV43_RR18414 [Rhamnella rubrinervis]|uniref:Uncharacterized protein n=1 Tax=Rhamnella rubrinervis TaxID=2594499 RepID=A0A8K0E0Q2_9ROSA|nr:hypothetical protein FNV43_RR18414 [Rhamnella rubrinervis]